MQNGIVVPDFGIPPGYCAMYVRLASETIFNKTYAPVAAWDVRYGARITWQDGDYRSWKDIIEPGDILGIMFPKSRHNSWNSGLCDFKGNERRYTHVGLCVDREWVIHQFGEKIGSVHIDDLVVHGFHVMEVMKK